MYPIFMIKFGRKEHLEQIVNGNVRFSPAEVYVKQEKEQHEKGQGDLLEGKIGIYFEELKFKDEKTKDVVMERKQERVLLTIDKINENPIFCLSEFHEDDVEDYINNSNYQIKIKKEKIESLKKDFKDADSALIILQPDVFISDVNAIENHKVFSHEILYYDYSSKIPDLDMFEFLCNTKVTKENSRLFMSIEDSYRILFCKDKDFINQQEYRFVIVDEKITKPQFYSFTFNSRYLLVSIEELETGIRINF